MTDDNGLYFMRARYYNPDIKRFITRDEFEGRYDEILNTNLYEYGNNNPVMNTDPEGEFIPLLIGAAYLAYRAWSAYDTYQDVRGAYQDYRAGNYGGLAEGAAFIGLGVAFGKVGKTAIKLARNTKMAGKVFKVSKGTGNTAKKIVRNINMVNDKYLKKLGIDAHALKKEVLGKKAKIAQYDIYVEKKTKELFVYLKGGKGNGIATGEFIK